MEKPFLSGNLKLDEASLRKIFIYNLNKIFPILLYLKNTLPSMAHYSFYGDLQNVIEELLSEVHVQIERVNDIFTELKEVPVEENDPVNIKLLQILTCNNDYEPMDNLSKDLSLVFYLQRIIAIKTNYFYILKSISNSFNSINIKQHLQYSCDECKENKLLFRLIAKEYMETSINNFLY